MRMREHKNELCILCGPQSSPGVYVVSTLEQPIRDLNLCIQIVICACLLAKAVTLPR
jgi:hypothetical protein